MELKHSTHVIVHGFIMPDYEVLLVKVFVPFLAYFPKVRLCDLHNVCVSVNPPINFWMYELIFMKLCIYSVWQGNLTCLSWHYFRRWWCV
jgi:hypothetical protein